MLCLGILWNSMQDHLQDVIFDIATYGQITNSFSMDLGNSYEKFVRDIYSQDEIAEWKVDKKVETMFQCSNSRKITVVFINIETSKMEYHILKKRMVYVNLENMKTEIRKKYSQLVDYYFFDNIFHVTDDEREYNTDLDVIKNYCNLGIQQESIEFSKPNIKVLKKEINKNEIRRQN